MTFTTDFRTLSNLNNDQFYELCRAHPDVKFERTPEGHLLIMAPTGGETGNRNIEISADFVIWNRNTKLGVLFDSSTGFALPKGGDRAPDLSWVAKAKWDALSSEARDKFPPIAPDFVLELMSPTDVLTQAQAKMSEYIESGVGLGWLINRKRRCVWVYRPHDTVQLFENPSSMSGGDVLPDFTLQMKTVW